MCIHCWSTCVRHPRGFTLGCKMFLLPSALSLVLRLTLLAVPVISQQCQLVRAGGQQPLDPSIPSPSVSPIANTVSSTSTSSTQPSSIPFVYGRDKVRGVNLCVISRLPASRQFPVLSLFRGGWFVLEVRSLPTSSPRSGRAHFTRSSHG